MDTGPGLCCLRYTLPAAGTHRPINVFAIAATTHRTVPPQLLVITLVVEAIEVLRTSGAFDCRDHYLLAVILAFKHVLPHFSVSV